MFEQLEPRVRGGGQVEKLPAEVWRLILPAGDRSGYRLAQLDDTGSSHPRRLPWGPPCTVELRARVSEAQLPGTWGFGFWNEPFSLGGSLAGAVHGLPALPQSAWFFYGSEPGHLSIYDQVPGSGFFAGVIQSSGMPTWVFLPGFLGLPLLLWPAAARLARRAARLLIQQAGKTLEVDATEWHTYRISWTRTGTELWLDGNLVLASDLSPRPPVSLVIWIDNQYAAFTPEGKLGAGILPNPDCWLEVQWDSR